MISDSIKKVDLLWTGGLDSTYRLVQLSRENLVIQPHYLVDATRKSVPYEKRSMNAILDLLKCKAHTKATILPVKEFPINEIKKDEEISRNWKKFHDLYQLGSQYDWLARYAQENQINLELGILTDFEGSKIGKTLVHSDGESKDITDVIDKNNDGVYQLKENASEELKMLFGRMRFPLIGLTKLEEVEFLKEEYSDILRNTWFCHTPIMGFPCGHCNPCKDAINEGLAWRVPTFFRLYGKVRNSLVRYIRKK